MARGINKVILIGNLGAEPETRYTSGGLAVTSVTIATSDVRKDRETGENKDYTEWHRVKFWNRLAEIAGEYLHKGSKVYIEGRLQTRKWQDAEGKDHYTTEIIANEMQMLDSRGAGAATGGEFNQAPARASSSSAAAAPKDTAPMDDFDDDIPF